MRAGAEIMTERKKEARLFTLERLALILSRRLLLECACTEEPRKGRTAVGPEWFEMLMVLHA